VTDVQRLFATKFMPVDKLFGSEYTIVVWLS
jgi:hypothetical protein